MKKRFLSVLLCLAMLTALCLTGAVLPASAEEADSVIVGGDFEAAAGDAVYSKNWASSVLKGSATSPACTIVEDTSGEAEGNHCLEVPLYTAAKYNKYLKGLSLQPNTAYTLSFDARGGQVWVFVGSYGVTDAPGVVWVGPSETWTRYSVTFHTGDSASALVDFVEWGISISRDPAYTSTIEAVSYFDNFKLEVAAPADTGIVTGGDFEAADASSVYTANWKEPFNRGATLVMDPFDSTNQCLKLPKVAADKDIFLQKVYLEPDTTYIYSFDAYAPEKARVYLWPNAFSAGGGSFEIKANTGWTTYTYELTTASDITSNVAYPSYLLGFPRTANAAETYIDNLSIVKKPVEEPEVPQEPDMSVEHEGNFVKGGSFEFEAGDAIYKTNLSTMSKLSIVTDPKNKYNQCLYIPQSDTKDYYFNNLKLEPLTTYVFEFDILNTGTAAVYFWGDKVFQNVGGSKPVAASAVWQHVSFEITPSENIKSSTAYPSYLISFLNSYAPYNQSDKYIDNISITEKQKEVPTVKQIVTGGSFEDETILEENFSHALGKGSVVEDTLIAGNHCLKLPAAATAIGDAYTTNVWLEKNSVYYVSFDMRGGSANAYFYPQAFTTNGARTLSASDTWKTYTFRVVTKDTDTYLSGGYEDWLVGFNKSAGANNTADTFIDNFRMVKAGAYVDPDLEHGSITLSTWKEPEVTGEQAVVAVDGTVTVTVTPDEGYMLKPGSLYYVTESGKQGQILNKESGGFGSGAGNEYRFVLPEGTVVVTAEFVPTAAQSFRFETLGTAVYYEAGATEPTGVRFLNRLYVEGLDMNGDTLSVVYDGKAYTITEFGSLLKRAANTETALTLENVNDAAPSATRVWKAAAFAEGKMKLVDYTESYLDFTVVMKTSVANEAFTQREYTACGYVTLTDGAKTVTLYSTGKTDSAANTAERVGYMPSKDDDWRLHPQDFKLIATTFDRPDFTDGTGKMETIIEALVAQGGSATLNVAGESLAEGSAKRESQIALLKGALEKGFEIGSYTWGNNTWGYSKDELNARTEEELRKYISDTQAIVQETLGVTPEYLRPPLLLSNATVTKICKELGISIVTGNTSWSDFSAGYTLEETGGATYESLTTHARDGAIWIIHAHNGEGPTEYAKAIADLYKEGYRFCTVDDLLTYNGVSREAGVTYNEVIAAY